jgi:pyridoxamine 5'-phosphate oxidase
MSESLDLATLRREFRTRPLDEGNLDPDPIRQFQTWMEEAIAAGVLDPNAMSVATVSAEGQPSLRTVLLKYFDASGFVFYTNLQSRKAREIAGNPRVVRRLGWPSSSTGPRSAAR